MAEKKELVKATLVEEVALQKINDYMSLGLTLPEGFNPTNSLKKARLMLNDMKVNGKPVMEVCTKESIMSCLIDSVMMGLDYSQGQIYFIPRGGVMTNLESVYGRITRAKRVSKHYKPIVNFVREGDDFLYEIDPTTCLKRIVRHTTKIENIDNPINYAYTIVTDNDGVADLFIMSKKQWLTSWKKSSNGCAVGKEFEEDMIFRTIIKKATKALVKSSNNSVIPTPASDNDDDALLASEQPNLNTIQPHKDYTDFEEVSNEDAIDAVDKETGEIKQTVETNNEEEDF